VHFETGKMFDFSFYGTAGKLETGSTQSLRSRKMAQLISERRDIDFVLYEQMEIEDLLKKEKYRDLNRKMFDMVISEARNLGIKEIYPTYTEGDREGIKFENGKVTVPECFHRPYALFVEGEWIAMAEDPEVGGQGLPHIIRQAAFEYIVGANFAVAGFGNLGHGAAKMIELFGTPKQKELFLKKVYSGQWGGTMLLTEPSAGSDVGALTTTAVKNPDGTYSISGNKILSSTRYWPALKGRHREPEASRCLSCPKFGSMTTAAWESPTISYAAAWKRKWAFTAVPPAA